MQLWTRREISLDVISRVIISQRNAIENRAIPGFSSTAVVCAKVAHIFAEVSTMSSSSLSACSFSSGFEIVDDGDGDNEESCTREPISSRILISPT
jgi:hypothetical protein